MLTSGVGAAHAPLKHHLELLMLRDVLLGSCVCERVLDWNLGNKVGSVWALRVAPHVISKRILFTNRMNYPNRAVSGPESSSTFY